MKKIYFLILLFLGVSAKAQYVTIPDANFVTFLTGLYPQCMNGNQMDTTCPAIMSEDYIDLWHQNLHDITGIQYFDSLRILRCNGNYLTFLPPLQQSIRELWCNSNQLTSIPSLPDSLTIFYPVANQLTSLPTLPNTITYIDCGSNLLTSLPALPTSLTRLNCNNNPQLTSLPPLPASLNWLECYENQLTNLPGLPPSLTTLICYGNQLTSLPPLPATLRQLECDDNQLTALPELPAFHMQRLSCTGNLLTTLPELPDSVSQLFCGNNPNLVCFPFLKKINYMTFPGTGITCLPNAGQVQTSNPPLNTFPLCDDSNNIHGCSVLWNITGKVFYDANNNCVANAGDTALRNITMQLFSGNTIVEKTTTSASGRYSFNSDTPGLYSSVVDTSNIPFVVSCPANNVLYDSITAADSLHYNRDFALVCKQGFDLCANSIYNWPPFVPGFGNWVMIGAGDVANFFGVHCASGISGSVVITINGPATFAAPMPGATVPSSIAGNVITYNVVDFGTNNFFSDYNFIVHTNANAQLGQSVCITLSITPTTGDNVPANNTLTHCFTVVGSWDPNDKQVYPQGDIDTSQKWLTYTVNFQNTGTAEARNVHVDDTLDTNLDASTFQLLTYSHQPVVQLKENALRFSFPNINLPDSNTNGALSHGYVQYKIKLKNNLPLGTKINNTAYIYFDFNAPVVTSTTTNTIALISSVADTRHDAHDFVIYPNPATSQLFILSNGPTVTEINIYNTTGSLISQTKQPLNNYIDISQLADGVYIAEMKTKEASVRKRWVKM